jgi:hypothetical protein
LLPGEGQIKERAKLENFTVPCPLLKTPAVQSIKRQKAAEENPMDVTCNFGVQRDPGRERVEVNVSVGVQAGGHIIRVAEFSL